MKIVRHTLSDSDIQLLKTCIDQGYIAATKTKDMPANLIEDLRRLHMHFKTAQRCSFTYIHISA